MRDKIKDIGWGLVAYGLILIVLTALLALVALVRSPDPPWQAYLILYGFAFVMIWGGFGLLKRVGAWPVSS
jgi:hypothetical protein